MYNSQIPYYLYKGVNVFMTICLFVCGITQIHWLKLNEKNQKMGLGRSKILLNFESDHSLNTKQNMQIYHLLIIMCLGEGISSQSALDSVTSPCNNVIHAPAWHKTEYKHVEYQSMMSYHRQYPYNCVSL